VAESACWICSTYIMEGKNSCNVGRVKEETIKGLFVRVFNQLFTDRARLLGDYKMRLEREKFDDVRTAKLDEEIGNLIRQERALFIIEGKGYADHSHFIVEHEALVSKLTKFQAERAALAAELTKQDSRMARTLELEAIIEGQGGPITGFDEDLYSRIIEKVIVKKRTCLVFQLKNGLAFEERYSLKRGHDIF